MLLILERGLGIWVWTLRPTLLQSAYDTCYASRLTQALPTRDELYAHCAYFSTFCLCPSSRFVDPREYVSACKQGGEAWGSGKEKAPDRVVWGFVWWALLDLNQRPIDYESSALTN